MISLGDGRRVQSREPGNIFISMARGKKTPGKLVLHRAMYVPRFDSNLLSCFELAKDGYTVLFQGLVCKIYKDNSIVAIAHYVDDLYIRKPLNFGAETAHVSKAADSWKNLWHWRYGHVHARCIEDMQRKASVSGIESDDRATTGKDCEDYIKGKMTRSTMNMRSIKAKTPGDIVFSDLCGPMPIKSLGEASYFVSFSDEASGFKMTRMLKRKNHALAAFKYFLALFERQYDCKVKIFYADQGGEFEGLNDYLKERGIYRECSAPYTPEQNGIDERLNRTVLEMSRAMLD